MKNTTSASLLHFTKNLSTLKSIISKGIRFSYSLESFPAQMVNYEIYGYWTKKHDENKKNHKVGIPMACFCDIPILRAQTHAKKYGNYVIGLNKEYMRYMYSPILNPVMYCNSENIIDMMPYFYFMKNKVAFDSLLKFSEENKYRKLTKEGLDMLIASSKEMEKSSSFKFGIEFLSGLFKYYSNPEDNNEIYYDEREWRAFWPNNLSEETNWIWDTDNLTKEDIKSCNKEIEKSDSGYIKIRSRDLAFAITNIIVNKEEEIKQMIQHIMSSKKIFGCNSNELSEIDKLKLIGKITSFERIERDF